MVSEPSGDERRRAAYLEASKIVQAALTAKYEKLGQPVPQFPAEPFRRWTPRAGTR